MDNRAKSLVGYVTGALYHVQATAWGGKVGVRVDGAAIQVTIRKLRIDTNHAGKLCTVLRASHRAYIGARIHGHL